MKGPNTLLIGLVQLSLHHRVTAPPSAVSCVLASRLNAVCAETGDLLKPPVHLTLWRLRLGLGYTCIADMGRPGTIQPPPQSPRRPLPEALARAAQVRPRPVPHGLSSLASIIRKIGHRGNYECLGPQELWRRQIECTNYPTTWEMFPSIQPRTLHATARDVNDMSTMDPPCCRKHVLTDL